MTTSISRRDWELLSTYLDDALDAGQKEQLVARLESSSEFRKALDELRSTRQLLRLVPQARPPRHFTLTREMLAARKGFWSQALSLNLLSAAATIMLVIVIIGDIGSSSGLLLEARAPALVAQDALQVEAAEMEKMSSPVPGGLGQADDEPDAEVAEALEAPQLTATVILADSPAAAEGDADAERLAPEADQLGEAADAAVESGEEFADDAADDSADADSIAADSDDAFQASPTAEDELMDEGAATIEQPAAVQSEAAVEEAIVEDQAGVSTSLLFRAAEIFLAALALVSGLAARRRRA